ARRRAPPPRRRPAPGTATGAPHRSTAAPRPAARRGRARGPAARRRPTGHGRRGRRGPPRRRRTARSGSARTAAPARRRARWGRGVRSSVLLGGEAAGEGLTALVEVGLGGALGAVEDGGEVGDAEVLEVVEGDRRRLAGRQLAHEGPEPVHLGRDRKSVV